jgi:hypothetical protein
MAAMTAAVRPVFQKQGPASNCVISHRKLGWKSCTAYAMAMGIDSATAGRRRPTGCKIRTLTGDLSEGITLSQVAAVAEATFHVRMTVRTGRQATSPKFAARAANGGCGFVLQGNTGALPARLRAGGATPCNHAVWVNEVRGGTIDVPDEALVYDPAADARRPGIDKGPTWWTWESVIAFAGALELDTAGRRLGRGRMYAGFTPRRPAQAPVAVVDGPTFQFGAVKTNPFPDQVRARPPAGRRVNVRSRPDRLLPEDIVDRLPDGAGFIAFQFLTTGAKPAGSNSGTWYGNRDGTEWVHESGLSRVGGPS